MSGLYAADGSWNVTVVASSTNVSGIYAVDGSLNVVISPGTGFVGTYAPNGALYVTVDISTGNRYPSRLASDGSLYVFTGTDYGNGQKVTVVSGSLSSYVPTYYIYGF